MHIIKIGFTNFNIEKELPQFIHHRGEGGLTGFGVNARRFVYLFATGVWLDHAKIVSLISPAVEPDEQKRKELLLNIFANASLSKALAAKINTQREVLAPAPSTEAPIPPPVSVPPPSHAAIIRAREEMISDLKRQSYIACYSGNMPPHCLWRGQFNCMRVPQMNPRVPPEYSIAKFDRAVQHAYAATQPISFYWDRLRDIKRECDDAFNTVQPLYQEFVRRFPTQGGISWRERRMPAVEETEEMAMLLSKTHEKLVALRSEATVQRNIIWQLKKSSDYYGRENELVKEITGQLLVVYEAAYYLKAFAAWLTEEAYPEKHVEPFKPEMEAHVCTLDQFKALNKNNYSALPKIYENNPLLIFDADAKEYVRLTVWKLRNDKWERIPAFIKILDSLYRYYFQAFLEPNSTYRIDQADMIRQDKDGLENIETVAYSPVTFIVNT